MADGVFITFEGIEGSGKTTQLNILVDHLKLRELPILATREPGGTPVGNKIRKVLLDPIHRDLDPLAELLLYEAARAEHTQRVILPALQAGKIVLCDRYYDATTAYQGAARHLSMELIQQLNQLASGGLRPRLTLLLDCPVEIGLSRARARYQTKNGAQGGDRIEQEETDFHSRVRQGYLEIAKNEPHRMILLNGHDDVDTIQQKIVKEVQRLL